MAEVKTFLRAVREHTGLFCERAPRRYGFMHLTFQEYYAARYLIARRRTAAKMLWGLRHDPRWDEPILLALGFVGLDYPEEAAELLETAILARGEEAEELHLAPSRYEDLLGRDYLFALRCLADRIPADPELVQKLAARLADELLRSAGSARFQRYQQALKDRLPTLAGSSIEEALVPPLVDALDDDEVDVRSRAAESLVQLGQAGPDTVADVVRALRDALGDDSVNVRYRAAASLVQLSQAGPEVMSALIEALQKAGSWSTRRDAARSLGQIGGGDEQTLSALWHGLQDSDNDVRTACSEALATLGQRFPKHAPAIEKKLAQAISDSAFDKPDSVVKRTGHDYAFDGLWLLIAGGPSGEA